MSAGLSRAEARVVCPYYRRVDAAEENAKKKGAKEKKVLVCASPLDERGENKNRFRSEDARREHEKLYCRSGRYPLCPLCKANDEARGFERPKIDGEGRRM